jgi:His-Xaa-Ser system protein HxsD
MAENCNADGVHSIELDSTVYELRAIKRASCDFTDKVTIKIERPSQSRIIVTLTPKGGKSGPLDVIAADFTNHVLDHQVRIEVESDYGRIREMIVAQAFAPCENLHELVDAIKP